MNKQKETWFSIDVETSGSVPGLYDLVSIGACVIGEHALSVPTEETQPAHDGSLPPCVVESEPLQPTARGVSGSPRAAEGGLHIAVFVSRRARGKRLTAGNTPREKNDRRREQRLPTPRSAKCAISLRARADRELGETV